MILVKVELHSARTGNVTEIGRMVIENDGETTRDHHSLGSYNVKVLRRGGSTEVTRTGKVANFPRKSYVIWRLIARALLSAFPEEVKHALTVYR